MFEAITNTMPKVQGGDTSSNAVPIKAPAGVDIQKAPESSIEVEQAEPEKHVDEKSQEESQRVTQEMLVELEQDIEAIHNIGLQFSMHDETGRTMIKIMDKATEKLIREIPSEDVLNLAAKIEEMIGILFDREV